MSNLMLFRTVTLRAISRCSEGTHFLTYKTIRNIKLPVTFRREYSVSVSYHFIEIDKMKSLWTCSQNLTRKGGISLLGNEGEPIFQGYVLPKHPECLVLFYNLFQ